MSYRKSKQFRRELFKAGVLDVEKCLLKDTVVTQRSYHMLWRANYYAPRLRKSAYWFMVFALLCAANFLGFVAFFGEEVWKTHLQGAGTLVTALGALHCGLETAGYWKKYKSSCDEFKDCVETIKKRMEEESEK